MWVSTTGKRWISEPPTECQLCTEPITATFIDGRLAQGPWALMCVWCHNQFGVGLGTGLGQRYDFQDAVCPSCGAWRSEGCDCASMSDDLPINGTI